MNHDFINLGRVGWLQVTPSYVIVGIHKEI